MSGGSRPDTPGSGSIITPTQLDILGEAISIGIGRAAGAFQQMTRSHVDLEAVRLEILPGHDLSRWHSDPAAPELVRLDFRASFQGTAALILSPRHAAALVAGLLGLEEAPRDRNPMYLDTLREVGNVVLIWTLGAIGSLLGEAFQYAPLQNHQGLDQLFLDAREGHHLVLLVQTRFLLGQSAIQGWILLLFPGGNFERLRLALDRITPPGLIGS